MPRGFSIPGVKEACLELWSKGFSGGLIAERLTRDFNERITRSAVLGYVHRERQKGNLLLSRRPGRRAEKERPHPRRPRKRAAIKVCPIVLPKRPTVNGERPAAPLPFLELGSARLQWHADRGCAMTLNDDACHPVWCNVPVWHHTAWCPHHYLEVYRQVPR